MKKKGNKRGRAADEEEEDDDLDLVRIHYTK